MRRGEQTEGEKGGQYVVTTDGARSSFRDGQAAEEDIDTPA
jgi:hypothetical protein